MISAAITAAPGIVSIARHVDFVPLLRPFRLIGSGQVGQPFRRANQLLGRGESAFLNDLRGALDAKDIDFFLQTVKSTRARNMAEGALSGSNYREVGTLTDLFIRIQRKGVPPLEDTESARTNRRRLVSVAQMQQIANELINGIVTTTPDDRDNLERITAANKIKTLLSNALLALVFKIVADTSDIRLLDMFARSLELFSSSYFDSEETDDGERKTVIRRWSRYQACNVEALANAFECSQLLARANVVELYAARQCGTNLALAIQAIKELDHFLNREPDDPHDYQLSLPAILLQAKLKKDSGMWRQCCGSSSETKGVKGQREQRDIMDGMSNVIKELTDGVLGYLDDCEASEATEALRDIAFRMRIT